MKISVTSLFYVLSLGLFRLAVPHTLLRGRVAGKRAAKQPLIKTIYPNSVNNTPDAFTGDPALAIVASSGGGDFFTKAWTGENAGDTMRGNGSCVAFRRTLKCNPSGPRDPKRDKTCKDIINSEDSGFCECGNYAQFAAVDCDHRPFTCEVMCMKFAVLTGKIAIYRGQTLSPIQARQVLNQVMWANQTDLEAMRKMSTDIQGFMTKALTEVNQRAAVATQSMNRFVDMMRVAHEKDKENAQKEIDAYKNAIKKGPWMGIWKNGQKMINAGQAIQAKVRDILPFNPVAAGLNNPLSQAQH